MPRNREGRLWVRLKGKRALIDYMEYRGYRNIRELAERVGVSKATIGHLHSGARTSCSPATARKIAKALDVPVTMLFDEEVTVVTRNNSRAA